MDSPVTLYTFPGTCAIVPHILLNYTGIPFNLQPIGKGMTDFAATNPKKQVPVLVIDGQAITENPAIHHAISLERPEAKIMGQDSIEFIRVCEWLNYLSAAIHAQAWGPYLRPWRYTNDPGAEEGIRKASEDKLKERFALIESKLPEDGWAVGKKFTAADAYLLPFFQWGKGRMELDMEKEYPKWGKLVQRLYGMESVQKSLDEERKIKEDLGPDARFG